LIKNILKEYENNSVFIKLKEEQIKNDKMKQKVLDQSSKISELEESRKKVEQA